MSVLDHTIVLRALETAHKQNRHDMLLTYEELRLVETAVKIAKEHLALAVVAQTPVQPMTAEDIRKLAKQAADAAGRAGGA